MRERVRIIYVTLGGTLAEKIRVKVSFYSIMLDLVTTRPRSTDLLRNPHSKVGVQL